MELFRAYDLRGFYPQDINQEVAYRVGRTFVDFLKCKNVVVGRDCRLSSPEIREGLVKGITEQGANVIDIGLTTTDVLYFAVTHYGYESGIMITASHCPKNMNGLKLVGKNGKPIGKGMGIEELKKIYESGVSEQSKEKGEIISKAVLDDFIENTFSCIESQNIKPLKVVADAGNSTAGLAIEKAFKKLTCELIPLYFDPDGNFPNHDPDPLIAENRKAALEAVKREKADLGVIFDGDGDRILFFDEHGNHVYNDFIVGLIAEKMLKKHSGRIILHDVRATWFINDVVRKNGGIPKKSLSGHHFFKESMLKENAVYGGEFSGHSYYNFGSYSTENSLLTLLHILELLSAKNKKLSELLVNTEQYQKSGEMNFEVNNQSTVIRDVENKYKNGEISHFDTLTVDFDDWRFNLRPSANDPVIRLNIEARNKNLLHKRVQEMSEFIEQFGKRLN